MKLYLMTDLEGVAGVLNVQDWCEPTGRYYEKAKRLLTLEVNAAVEGFFEAGASSIIVLDGHGWGAIDAELLDERVELGRGWPQGYPLLLDATFDAVAFVGQHAKAGTPYAHLPHTGNAGVLDLSINDLSIGEFGEIVLCASELGVRTIFASGDLAFTREAQDLLPGIEIVAVKRGTTPWTCDDVAENEYHARTSAAIHLHPAQARRAIRQGARRAIERARGEDFGIRKLPSPYRLVRRKRPRNPGDAAPPTTVAEHPTSVAGVLNAPEKPMP
ncbi:MAG: M55 family metallopeptidase [Planctomycetota bacterium]